MINFKPLLPKYSEYVKYLKKIDKKRIYSNYGPYYFKTKKIIESYLKLKKRSVVLTSSGDASLFACFKYLKYINKKKYILTPSFSFPSDVHSIINSGFEPIFFDINIENWVASETEIIRIVKKNNNIAGILIVSPFGFPIDINNLNNLKLQTKVEIIYDAADTFLNLKNTDNINFFITASFHPTKNVPGNESGMIICNKSHEKLFKEILNFGQESKKKDVKIFGFNGKISEYDCAILLASLKKLSKIKKKIKFINRYIIKNVTNNIIIFQKDLGKNWFSNKVNFYSENFNPSKIKKIFLKKKIYIYKPWTGRPMHLHKFFKNYKKYDLKNTLFLTKRIFSLPINYDLQKKDIKKICKILNKLQ